MHPPTRMTRRFAALIGILHIAGCSDIALDAAGDDGFADDGYGESEDTESGPSTTGDPTEGDTSGTDTSGTDTSGAEDGPEEGLGDPHLLTPACDPFAGQQIAFDLAEANAEIAPELVRESVMSGASIPAIPLSSRPFFNHFEFEHPAASEATLAISGELWKPQMMLNEVAPRYQLHVAVSGPALSDAERPNLDLVLVADVGPSMAGAPLELADHALAQIAGALRVGDRVSLISAGDQPELLGTVLVEQGVAPTLPSMLAEVLPAASSAIDPALELAYDTLAELEPLADAQTRVILISAGHFVSGPDTLARVDSEAELGTTLTTIGVGPSDTFVESSLRALAVVGKGASLYEPNLAQIDHDLGEQLATKLITSADEVSVELELPAGLAISQRDPNWGDILPAIELGRLGPNDALIFQHELESCGELATDAEIRVVLEWREPGGDELTLLVWTLPVDELGFGSMATRKGAAVLAYTQALIAYRDDADARYGALLDALGQISAALESMPNDPDLIEMSEVLAKLESM